jgi:acyl carrier protein
MYGISETTVHVTARKIQPSEVTASFSPIGAPLPGAELYTLNGRLLRTPIGVEGELVVGGGGLARGYVGQPALTAQKFVPHRLTNASGARCYRSGDLGRRLGIQELVFNGRRDSQLKVRGYRVELAEISAALASHEAAAEQAVIVRRGNSAADDSVAAFVVPSPEQRVSEPELRAHLAARLPSYMVPATICVVDALPVTANGKLDTAALLAQSADSRSVNRAPRTDTERRIAEIWSRLFGGRNADIEENFFECGGHSLLATRLAVDLREAFDRELSVRAVFERPSIAELARLIDAAPPRAAAEAAASKIGRASRLRRSSHESRGGSR